MWVTKDSVFSLILWVRLRMPSKVFVTLRVLLCVICILLILNVLINYFGDKVDIPSSFSRLSIRKLNKNNVSYIIRTPANETVMKKILCVVSHGNVSEPPTQLNVKRNHTFKNGLPFCREPIYEGNSLYEPNITLESLDVIEAQLSPFLEMGGAYQPKHCNARHHVAIVVPFRDRYAHLSIFVRNIHPFLMKQNISYRIFVIEQSNGQLFNRAALMNVGFLEARKLFNWDCFIFHDVDLIPLDHRNLYNCPRQPRHMSVAVDQLHYTLPYRTIFGGVSAMTQEHFLLVNGFSNSFFGWGGEDDDMSNRLRRANLYIARYPVNIARYIMLKHQKEKANPNRFEHLVKGVNKIGIDGLNSIKYEIYSYKSYATFTWYYAELKILQHV